MSEIDLSRQYTEMLEKAKKRAIEYLESGDRNAAAKEYGKCATLEDKLVQYEVSPKVKKNREEKSKMYMGYAEILRKGGKLPFEEVKREVRVGEKKEILDTDILKIEKPTVTWDDVIGPEDVRKRITQAIEIPLKRPDLLEKWSVRPWHGIVLYGPPRCGKTLFAKAAAHECDVDFYNIDCRILSSYYGESEQRLAHVFEKARENLPAILFFDEIDSFVPKRGGHDSRVDDRITNQFLRELDGMGTKEGLLVIGATNRPDLLDSAMLGPKRLEIHVFIPPPDLEGRIELFKLYLKNKPKAETDYKELAKLSEGFSGGDIEAVCNMAAMEKVEEEYKTGKAKIDKITMEDIISQINNMKPEVERLMPTKAELEDMLNWGTSGKRGGEGELSEILASILRDYSKEVKK